MYVYMQGSFNWKDCDDSEDEFCEDAVPINQNCRTCNEEVLPRSLNSGRYSKFLGIEGP